MAPPNRKRAASAAPCAPKVPRQWLETPQLPPLEDPSAFRLIELENGLRALLISSRPGQSKDPAWALTYPDLNSLGAHFEEKPSYLFAGPPQCAGPRPGLAFPGEPVRPKCTASIHIGAGAYEDPPDFPGLAHFCEHVVHHGSELFPDEDELRRFIHEHEGYSNAYTDRTVTNYHFHINSSRAGLEKALLMYGSMLAEPLFPLDAVEREVESVDNEYFLRRCVHFFQRHQLLNSTAIDGPHPMKQFMIGSKESLLPKGHESAEPLQTAVMTFHRAHYYAENMRLVVRAPESLDFMEEAVRNGFSEIPAKGPKDGVPKVPGPSGNPYDIKKFNRLYTVKPRSNDGHELYVTWALPATAWKNTSGKPLSYIGALFQDEGPGGLAHYLRSKGWILSIAGGCMPSGASRNEYVSMFEVILILTQSGRARVDEVIESVFSFLKLHKGAGPQAGIWNRLQRSEEIKFQGMKLGDTVDATTRLSGSMLLFPDSQIVTGESLFGTFDPKAIQTCLDTLTPQTANYMLFTTDTGNKHAFDTEALYDTEYLIQALEPAMLERFERVEPYGDFQVRAEPNPLAELPVVGRNEVYAVNEIVAMSSKVVVAYHPNREMVSSQAIYMVRAMSGLKVAEMLAKSSLIDVWICMLKLQSIPGMNNQSAMGTRFGFHFDPATSSILFQIVGLNNGLQKVTETIVESFDRFEDRADPALFRLCKEFVLRSYYASSVNPRNLAVDMLGRLQFVERNAQFESYEALKGYTFGDLLTFVDQFKEAMCLVANVQGLVERKDAMVFGYALEGVRTRRALGLVEPAVITRKFVGLGERCLRVKSILPKERMTSVVNYYQLAHSSPETVALTKLICDMIQGRLFHQLRTIEQLGYCVAAYMSVDSACTALIVDIATHADKHSPCYIDERIDVFLRSFYRDFLTAPEISAQLQKRQISRDPSFVQSFFSKYLLKGGIDGEMKKLSVQVVGCKGGKCLCGHYREGPVCRNSVWLSPVGTIGKYGTPIQFANRSPGSGSQGDVSLDPTPNYFIDSILEYHNTT